MIIQLTLTVVALLHLILGFVVLRAQRRNPVNQAFAAQSFVFAGWVFGIAGLQDGVALTTRHGFAFAFASLIPVAFLLFSSCYPAIASWSSPLYVRVFFLIGMGFMFLSFGTDLIVYDVVIDHAGLSRKPGPLYLIFALYFLLTWCVGLAVFVGKWRKARGVTRAQFNYMGVGVIAGFTGGICANLIFPLVTGQATYNWLGPYFSLIYVGFVGHAIIRHRLMDLRLFIHRGLTVAVATILSALPVGLLLLVLWPKLLTALSPSELALLLVAIGAATILIPLMRDAASALLDRYVYRTHANYQRTVREASRMLTRLLDLRTLLAFITSTIARSTSAGGVALYLKEDDEFCLAVSEISQHAEHFAAPPRIAPEVVTVVVASHAPILADDLSTARLNGWLVGANWHLILPVVAEDTLIAFVAVGPKLSGDIFYRQDLDLLMTLANHAGVAIKNAQLYAAASLANEYLENIAATMESGVVAINASGRVEMFNRAAERLTGMPEKALKGRSTETLPACLAESLMETVATGEARTQPEVDLPTVAPSEGGPASRPVICTVSPVRDPAGAVLGAVAVFSDLTPLKELEVERRRAERLAYFQALAGGIAHEIKNPLVAIKTFAQLLPRRRGDARFLEEFGRIASRDIDRMQRLVDRLRTLSRPAGGPRAPIDLRAPMIEALELMQPTLDEKGLTTTARLGDTPCVVLGNHLELHELFLNLLLNAHDATPTGGAVEVELARADGHAILTVGDTGPGIAPELLERVFEPFFTTKPRGSGLGLAISAAIAQAHGARLRAHNRAANGAVFTLEFPLPSVVPLAVS